MNVCMNMQKKCPAVISYQGWFTHMQRQTQEMNYEYQKCSWWLWSPLGNSYISLSPVIAQNRFLPPPLPSQPICVFILISMNWTISTKKWFLETELVKLCIKTTNLVMPPSVTGLLETAFFGKSNVIPSAGDIQASVLARVRLTKGLNFSLNFFRRNLVDYIIFSLIIIVHVPKRFMAQFSPQEFRFPWNLCLWWNVQW